MATATSKQQGMSKLVVILLIAILVVLLAVGGAVAAYLTGMIGSVGNDEPQVEQALDEPIYIELDPALTVNFERGGRISYLQARVQLETRYASVEEAIDRHMPVIRNNLLDLFADQDYQEVNTRAGREALRQAALEEVNQVLAERGVEQRLEAVYFTRFVMQ
ncbi:flagellar basal body-associated FliL family protein [Alkalilimnicola ehrlichii MLHE-1]|uniref:Flagellar protein FliL n=1 Tax=Alkalilimnicola ehrlichii (strain ATCC BAA-1101 / DSM 17681 / MLHE-1) TaxID=187272 RepID=Q0AA10_ALKEH|nr:flagellar basal body-associated FliL family protein [Alkalilimnicola ehrlichii]ABI56327.1 flagellar basal body-associated protein FliL [Alkalilimnicola ehrlichii MLHE-1]